MLKQSAVCQELLEAHHVDSRMEDPHSLRERAARLRRMARFHYGAPRETLMSAAAGLETFAADLERQSPRPSDPPRSGDAAASGGRRLGQANAPRALVDPPMRMDRAGNIFAIARKIIAAYGADAPDVMNGRVRDYEAAGDQEAAIFWRKIAAAVRGIHDRGSPPQ
ncbi:MAG: hypothetical protein HY060_22385 [Proteobacteria bacterium]|nr:hypothetical protein [Pseudomonadota bacterium]